MERIERLIQSGLVLSSELSLSGVLQRIIELAVEITGARYGALGVVGPDGRLSEFITTGISAREREAIGDPPIGHGILGMLIREARSIRIDDISKDPRAHGFPPNHPPMRSFLGTAIVAHGSVFGDIYLTEKRGGPFTEEDVQAIEILASQAGVAIENARLYEESRRRERWLEAVREIANLILTGGTAHEALELVARRARELLGGDLATVSVPDRGRGDLVVEVADGAHADELRGATFPIEGSISGEVVRTGKALVITDASKDERAYQPVVELGEMGPAVLVPLTSQGRAFGTLLAANMRGGPGFTDQDVLLLETFADQAALALEYARVQAEVQRLVVLEDRERIAKELHDGVIQALFAVGMGLQGTALMAGDRELAERIESAVAELDRVIRDLRNYIFGLRPGILADRQLDQALRQLGEEFEQRSGVVTVVEVDSQVASELTSLAADVIQLTRESLSNVGRHADAATCRVSLYRKDHEAVLEIDDDGKGFDPDTTRRGDGLLNLERRAETLGGKASIESSPSQGTTVRLMLPL